MSRLPARSDLLRFGLLLVIGLTLHGCYLCRCPAPVSESDPRHVYAPASQEAAESAVVPDPIPIDPSLQKFVDEALASGPPQAESRAERQKEEKELSAPADDDAKPAGTIAEVQSAEASGEKGTEPVLKEAASPELSVTNTRSAQAEAVESSFFTIDLYPTSLYVAPGQRKTARVTINRKGSFRAPVTIDASGIPPHVRSNAPVTVPADAVRGFLTLTAARQASYETSEILLTGSTTVKNRPHRVTQKLSFFITRQRGPFQEATLDYRRPGGQKNSPNKKFAVRLRAGSKEGHFHKYFATFQDGQGKEVARPIEFYMDPASRTGGVGFCPGSRAAVVLSTNAKALGMNSDYMLGFQTFTDSHSFMTYEVRTSTNGKSFVLPRVFFSPDCTLAMFVEADQPEALRQTFTIVDLVSGLPLAQQVPVKSRSVAASAVVKNRRLQVQIQTNGKRRWYPLP